MLCLDYNQSLEHILGDIQSRDLHDIPVNMNIRRRYKLRLHRMEMDYISQFRLQLFL